MAVEYRDFSEIGDPSLTKALIPNLTEGDRAGNANIGDLTQYQLNVGNYTGELWIGITKTFELTEDTDGLTNIGNGSEILLSKQRCGSADAGGEYVRLLEFGLGGAGFAWESSSTKPIHTSQFEEYQLCFLHIFVAGAKTVTGNTAPVKVASFKIDTFSDSAKTAKINQVDQIFDVYAIGTEAYFMPLYACPDQAASQNAEDVLPVFSAKSPFSNVGAKTYNSEKHIYVAVPASSSTATLPYVTRAPNKGDVIQANYSHGTGTGGKTNECYIVGDPVSSSDIKESMVIPVDKAWNPTAPDQVAKSYFNFDSTAPISSADNRQGWAYAKGVACLHPGEWSKNQGQGDCGSCAKSRDVLHWGKKNDEVLRAMGFTCGFTGTTFSNAIFRNQVDDGSGAPGEDYQDVLWGTSVAAAHDIQPLWALPDAGAGTRVYKGGGAEIKAPMDKQVVFKKAQFWYTAETAVNHSWTISKLVRGVIRRSFGAGSEEMVFDGINADGDIVVRDVNGNLLKENISVISASQIELVAKEIMTHSSSISAGVSVDELFKATINMSFNTSSTEEESAIGSETSESTNWTISSQIDMAGFGKWLSLDAGTAAGDVGWEMWKDSLSISMQLGSGSSSTVKATEFDMVANLDGSVTINEDPEDAITTVTKNMETTGGLFELQSLKLDYNAEIFNGYDLSISPPSLSRTTSESGEAGVDCTDLSMWSYSLSGDLKDKIKWTLGYHAGSPSLAVAARIDVIADSSSDSRRGRSLLGPLKQVNGASMYINTGLNVVGGGGQGGSYEFHPSLTVAGKIKGIEYNANLISGTKYLKASWGENFTDSYPSFLASEGDTLEVNFNLRADYAGNAESVTDGQFMGSADILFRKTLVEFNDIGGRLILEVNAFAQISAGVDTAAVLASKDAGFGATVGLKWENNILDWFGLPFNLHPSLKAGFAANLMFGGKTRDVYSAEQTDKEGNSYKNKIIEGVNYEPKGSATFVVGPIAWDWKPVDSFKQELRRKHNSIFSGLGLGACPLLNVLGSKEEVWEYILRAGPFRAMGAINRAAGICAKKRGAEFERVRNLALAEHNKMVVAHQVEWNQIGAKMPWCGEKEAHPSTNKRGSACRTAFSSGRTKKLGHRGQVNDHEALEKCWKEVKETSSLTGPRKYATLRYGIYQQSLLKAPYSGIDSPYPCQLTKHQMLELLIDRMQLWDESFDRCACIEFEFHKLSGDRYHGRDSNIISYSWMDWEDELSGDTTEMGVINRGFDIIDAEVLALVRQGKSPIDTKVPEPTAAIPKPISPAQEFGRNITAKIEAVMDDVNLNSADKKKIREQLKSTFGDKSALVEWWVKGGICSVPLKFFSFVTSAASWMWEGVSGLFSSGSKIVDNIAEGAYDTKNPCKVINLDPETKEPKPSSEPDNCYKEWKKWEYYQASYDKALIYFNELNDGKLNTYLQAHYDTYKIAPKGKVYDEPACKPCRSEQFLVGVGADPKGLKTSNTIENYLKTYMIMTSSNLSFVDTTGLPGTWTLGGSPDFETSLSSLTEGPVIGSLGAGSSISYGNEWMNGGRGGARFPMYFDLIASSEDPDHPCFRGYTEEEYDDASGSDWTPYISNPTSKLTNEICSSDPVIAGTLCSAAEQMRFKPVMAEDLSSFESARKLAKDLGDPYIGVLGNNKGEYLKFLRTILTDPALSYYGSSSYLADFWTSDLYGFAGAYSYFTSIMPQAKSLSAEFTGTGLRSIISDLRNLDNAVKGISPPSSGSDLDFARNALTQLKNYQATFRKIIREAFFRWLCDNDYALRSLKYQNHLGGGPAPRAVDTDGVVEFCKTFYTALYGSVYGIEVPDLGWLLKGGAGISDIPVVSYADEAAMVAGTKYDIVTFVEACYSGIVKDGYVRLYAEKEYASEGEYMVAVKNNTDGQAEVSYPSGSNRTAQPKTYSVKDIGKVKWPVRNAHIFVEGGAYNHAPVSCSDYNLIHQVLGTACAVTPWSLSGGTYLRGKGHDIISQYFHHADPAWREGLKKNKSGMWREDLIKLDCP